MGLLILIVSLILTREDSRAAESWVFVPGLLLPGLYIVKLISDSYSVLEVDERGVRVRRVLGGTDLAWTRISRVQYREQLQMVHGAMSREYFLEIRDSDGKRLLRLKSTYDVEAYIYLMEQAKNRGLQVEKG